jgi:putative flippase GtrA
MVAPPPFRTRTPAIAGKIAREFGKFGVVGVLAFVVDVGGFNLLRFAGGEGPLFDWPLAAKVLSAAAATVVSWVGNRLWTFRQHRRPAVRREFLLFVGVCVLGTLLALACLALSHYVLGLQSALADNMSANVIGLGLATMFRFWAYRSLVFNHDRAARPAHRDTPDAVPAGRGLRRKAPAVNRIRSTIRNISRPSAMVLPRSPVTEDSPTRG